MSTQWMLLGGTEWPLLVSSHFGQSDYLIHVTDLTHLWRESLDRKSILKRALNTDASIDPSEDGSQMRLLLSSIRKAINGESGSQLSIRGDHDGDKLDLNLSIFLPDIDDLKWRCELERQPISSTVSMIMVPLMATQLRARDENRALLAQIRQKDVVISKMMAQMQADGSDFGKIFPGAVAARKSHKSNIRESLGRSVPGLAEFSEDTLKEDITLRQDESWTAQQILSLSCPILLKGARETDDSLFKAGWWNALRQTTSSGEEVSGTKSSPVTYAKSTIQTPASDQVQVNRTVGHEYILFDRDSQKLS